MAPITNTFRSFSSVGNREDLADTISNISPEETPFMTKAGRGKAKSTLYEWQTDTLADADTANYHVEGDETTIGSVTATVRLGNRTQISKKSVRISGTQEAVDKAGRKAEMAYQMAKRSAELKRDMESILLSNQAAVAAADGTAGRTGSLLAFIKTNQSVGTSGAAPVYTTLPNATRTDGTQRAISEALLKVVLQSVWTQGGDPSTVMVGAFNKAAISAFAGIATQYRENSGQKAATILASADVYVGEFGTVSIVPNRWQRTRDALVLDFEYCQVDFLRPFKVETLAKTGDAESKHIIVEYGLRVKNEKALGILADLTTS